MTGMQKKGPAIREMIKKAIMMRKRAGLTTFDAGFTSIARCLPLHLQLLTRPT